MSEEKEIIPYRKRADLGEIAHKLIDAGTGIFKMDKADLAQSIAHIAHGTIRGRFIETVAQEWDSLKEKGRIAEDYVETNQYSDCFSELLRSITETVPNETRFEAIKKVFLHAACEKDSNRDDPRPFHYLYVLSTLEAGEIQILAAAYDIAKNRRKGYTNVSMGASEWLSLIASHTGMINREMVGHYEENLITKRLIMDRFHSDRSGAILGQQFRLTDFGFALCDFIESYHPERNE